MVELSSLVDDLEAGNLSLDDALKTFERGVSLTRQCQDALQHAEQRVRILLDGDADANVGPDADTGHDPDADVESVEPRSPGQSAGIFVNFDQENS